MSSKYQWEAIEKKKTKGYIVSVSKQDSSVVIKNIYWGDDFYEEMMRKSKIWFIDVEGNRFEYKVSDIEIIKGTNVKQMEKGKWDMTLFTCTYGGQNRMALRCTLTNAVAGEN